MLAGRAISCKSVKSSLFTLTMEVEFVVFFEATNQVLRLQIITLWLQNFISGLKIVHNINRTLMICNDNSIVVFLLKNDKYSKGTKHMYIKYLFVKEEVSNHISKNFLMKDKGETSM